MGGKNNDYSLMLIIIELITTEDRERISAARGESKSKSVLSVKEATLVPLNWWLSITLSIHS